MFQMFVCKVDFKRKPKYLEKIINLWKGSNKTKTDQDLNDNKSNLGTKALDHSAHFKNLHKMFYLNKTLNRKQNMKYMTCIFTKSSLKINVYLL